MHIRSAMQRSGLWGTVVASLAMLELKGLIRQSGAMQYVRSREEREEYVISEQ